MDQEEKKQAERLQESLKLEYEWHKHLTTLISGIAVAIVTVTQAFFPSTKTTGPYTGAELILLGICFVSLGIGLLASIFFMYRTIRHVRNGTTPSSYYNFFAFLYPVLTLINGIGIFVLFAWWRGGF